MAMFGSEEKTLKAKTLIYNAVIYTQSESLVVDSMAIYKNKIIAVGNNLEHDPDFKTYSKINLQGKTIIPGLTDAHTHFFFFAISLGRVKLHDKTSLEACLDEIKSYAKKLKKNEWVVGEGLAPDQFDNYLLPDKYMLDKVTGGRPAFIFTKDQHSAWVNSKALELAGITSQTKNPDGGEIVKFENGEPTGILREMSSYIDIYNTIPLPSDTTINKLYKKALEFAYQNGVTAVHSFDQKNGFAYFAKQAEKGTLGLRINYYFPDTTLDELLEDKILFGTGNEYLRLAGIKLYSDGALGSQTALCFHKYIGSKNNFGIEVESVKSMFKKMKKATKLGFPCAVHAIGDKAVSNVLDAIEQLPQMHFGARHRIEHLQLVRRKDIKRIKELNVVASMQPSHCPSDIKMIHKYWGKQGANAFLFKTLQKKNIDIAFGSDAPIEPLKPLEGIAAAVTRAKPKSREKFYPDEKITATEALYNYTVGPAKAVGQEHCRGSLIPDYPADFVILSDDVTKTAPSKLYDIKALATVFDGKVKYDPHNLLK